MNPRRLLPTLFVLVLLLAACSAGANPETGIAAADGDVAGFWMGLWHGLIAPVTFLISLFKDTVNVYDVHNNGNWYDFGFMFGLSISLGGSSRSAKRRR
jgi:hypothetical protein